MESENEPLMEQVLAAESDIGNVCSIEAEKTRLSSVWDVSRLALAVHPRVALC